MTKKHRDLLKQFNLASHSHSVIRKQVKANPRTTKSNSFIIPVYLGGGEKDKIPLTQNLKHTTTPRMRRNDLAELASIDTAHPFGLRARKPPCLAL